MRRAIRVLTPIILGLALWAIVVLDVMGMKINEKIVSPALSQALLPVRSSPPLYTSLVALARDRPQ